MNAVVKAMIVEGMTESAYNALNAYHVRGVAVEEGCVGQTFSRSPLE